MPATTHGLYGIQTFPIESEYDGKLRYGIRSIARRVPQLVVVVSHVGIRRRILEREAIRVERVMRAAADTDVEQLR